MTIVACFKWVIVDQDLRTDPLTHHIDFSRARSEISPYDRNTIAAARILADSVEADLVGITVGDISANGLKEALGRGLDSALTVSTPFARDGRGTSRVLAKAISTVPDVDLVITGEGAADTYAHETAPRIAELLGWPVVTNARKLAVSDGILTATRVLEDAIETVEVALPAVVSVIPEAAQAPIPGLKALMAGAKKPRTALTLEGLNLHESDVEPIVHATRTRGFVTDRRRILHEGTPEEAAASLVSALDQEGLLS